MNPVFPEWYFSASGAAARGAAVNKMLACWHDGNEAGYQAALREWQSACGGLNGCPGWAEQCPWNPPDTNPKACVMSYNPAGQLCLGGVALPTA